MSKFTKMFMAMMLMAGCDTTGCDYPIADDDDSAGDVISNDDDSAVGDDDDSATGDDDDSAPIEDVINDGFVGESWDIIPFIHFVFF